MVAGVGEVEFEVGQLPACEGERGEDLIQTLVGRGEEDEFVGIAGGDFRGVGTKIIVDGIVDEVYRRKFGTERAGDGAGTEGGEKGLLMKAADGEDGAIGAEQRGAMAVIVGRGHGLEPEDQTCPRKALAQHGYVAHLTGKDNRIGLIGRRVEADVAHAGGGSFGGCAIVLRDGDGVIGLSKCFGDADEGGVCAADGGADHGGGGVGGGAGGIVEEDVHGRVNDERAGGGYVGSLWKQCGSQPSYPCSTGPVR